MAPSPSAPGRWLAEFPSYIGDSHAPVRRFRTSCDAPPETSQSYFIVDGETHRRAMEALRRQQDCAAIAQGIAEMEAGKGKSLAEAFDDIRSIIGLRQRQR